MMIKKSRFIQIIVNLLFVFLSSFGMAQSFGQALQQRLIETSSSLSLQIKIENLEKQRYDVMIVKGLLKMIDRSQSFMGAGEYTIDLKNFDVKILQKDATFFGKLFSSSEENADFVTSKYSKNIFVKSTGLALGDEEQILESLITYVSVSAENEHRQKFSMLSSLPNKQNWNYPRSSSGVQRKIYFLVGHLQFLDNEMHDFVLEKIQPYFEEIRKKGFDYIYIPYARVSDLMTAMNNEETLAIYWISHSQTVGQAKKPYVLDADKNIVPAEIFAQNHRRQPVHLAMIACYPEKVSKTYGIDQIIEDRQMATWYSEGANNILKENVIRPIGFSDYLNSLPTVHPGAQVYSKLYNKLSMEVSGAFPLSNKFYVLLNGRYISTIKYNQTSGFESFSILIPKEFFKDRNQITIRTESSAEQALRDSQIIIRNLKLSDERNGIVLYRNDAVSKVGKPQESLTLFGKREDSLNLVESLDFTL